MSREEWKKFYKWADSETYGSEYYGLRKLREDTPAKIKKEYKQYLEKEKKRIQEDLKYNPFRKFE